MSKYPWKELLIEKTVNYVMEEDGKLYIFEKVPARVNPETGEQLHISKNFPALERDDQRTQEACTHDRNASIRISCLIFNFLILGEQNISKISYHCTEECAVIFFLATSPICLIPFSEKKIITINQVLI